ncbi:helix-turn-helix domain-containing protein [Burkholderia multivorans]|uniref:helix-turn-helix domain-containing protein n=1 Tax=Burkholderia multivorans TaxID=87883 RepID=UPI0021BE97D2|nr:helix-turn-helix transcriptional regulator [Burkholderia multivorans]
MNDQQQSRADALTTTKLPDGSGFAVASLPLPQDHWLYASRCAEWDSERDTSADTPHPILTHAQRDAVVAAVRYAIRSATMCGQDMDFDPDALVLNAVYALCGPFSSLLEDNAASPVEQPAAVQTHYSSDGGSCLNCGQALIDHKGGRDCPIAPADERAAFVKLMGYDRPETEGVAVDVWDSQRTTWLEALAFARATSANETGAEVAQWQMRLKDRSSPVVDHWVNISPDGAKTLMEKYTDVYEVRALYTAPRSPAMAAEPVAWRSWKDGDGYGFWDTRDEAELASAHDFEPEPLYIAPADAGEAQPSLTNPLTPYGMLVRALRIVSGTTLMDMAKALLTTPAKLSAMEFGRAPVTPEFAFDVAAYFDALGVPCTESALRAAARAQGGES